MIISITGCARCHGDGHEDLDFQPLKHPFQIDGILLGTHWAMCPTLNEPIMLTTGGHVIDLVDVRNQGVRDVVKWLRATETGDRIHWRANEIRRRLADKLVEMLRKGERI